MYTLGSLQFCQLDLNKVEKKKKKMDIPVTLRPGGDVSHWTISRIPRIFLC